MNPHVTTPSVLDAVARARLFSDLMYIYTLFSGLAIVSVIIAFTAVYIFGINSALPLVTHRPYRLVLGIPALVFQGALSFYIFSPETCALGAAGAGTLAVFNSPLRAIHLLVSPPPPIPVPGTRKSTELSPLALTVLLMTIPACPLTSLLDLAPSSAPSRKLRQAPARPSVQIFKALIYFFTVSVLCQVYPVLFARTSIAIPVLTFLIAVMTSGFASLSASTFTLATSLPCSQAFTSPFLSPSLASFWAYRWNAPMACALRRAVYDPVIHLTSLPPAVATLGVFGASGAAHAAIVIFAGLGVGAKRWGIFFLFQGAAVLVERALFRKKKGIMRRLFTVVVLWWSCSVLFVTPVLESPRFPRLLVELGSSARIGHDLSVVARYAFS